MAQLQAMSSQSVSWERTGDPCKAWHFELRFVKILCITAKTIESLGKSRSINRRWRLSPVNRCYWESGWDDRQTPAVGIVHISHINRPNRLVRASINITSPFRCRVYGILLFHRNCFLCCLDFGPRIFAQLEKPDPVGEAVNCSKY